MSSEAIHLFALISVRALAESDQQEFLRVCSRPKKDLDEQISHLFRLVHERDAPEIVHDLTVLLTEFEGVLNEAKGSTELTFLMHQLSASAMLHAQQLALTHVRRSEPGVDGIRPASLSAPVVGQYAARASEEQVRLATMRLLRDLPEYRPIFEYAVRGTAVDCMLEPMSDSMPVIFLEAKLMIRSLPEAQKAVKQLKDATVGWGQRAMLAVVTGQPGADVVERWVDSFEKIHLLVYDQERNVFTSGLEALLEALRSPQT